MGKRTGGCEDAYVKQKSGGIPPADYQQQLAEGNIPWLSKDLMSTVRRQL